MQYSPLKFLLDISTYQNCMPASKRSSRPADNKQGNMLAGEHSVVVELLLPSLPTCWLRVCAHSLIDVTA